MNHLYVAIEKPLTYFHNTQTIFAHPESLNYHRHNACEIFVLLKGTATFYVEHSCYELIRGDMVLLTTDELHRSMNKNQTDYESIGLNIQESVLKNLSSDHSPLLKCFNHRKAGEKNLIHLNELDLSSLVSHFQAISSLLNDPAFGSDLLINAHLSQIGVKVNRLYTEEKNIKNRMPKLVQDTMHYIKENLTSDLQLKHLEKHLNYNGSYISYCFKHHTGLTIRAYILDQRILTAKRYLSAGYSVQESCTLSGFNDYSNFIRSFSKITGITPGKFKSSHL